MENLNWISVSEQLPDKDDSYLCYDKYQGMIRVLCYNIYYNCWDDEYGDDVYTSSVGGQVTHWMSLPKRPEN